MSDPRKFKSLLRLAIWHVSSALEILKRLFGFTEKAPQHPPAQAPSKPDALAGDAPVLPPADSQTGSPLYPPLPYTMLDFPVPGGIGGTDYNTTYVVEIRGRLETTDQRELRINGKTSFKLDRREHTVLLILAWHARCLSTSDQAHGVYAAPTSDTARALAKSGSRAHGRNCDLPAFMPVRAIVAIVERLTAEGGPLAGRWSFPMDTDIHRCVSKLRARLCKKGFNPNLIESGQRPSGYRLSTPVDRIFLCPEGGEDFWRALLDGAFKRGDSPWDRGGPPDRTA